jgi:hypothetical protein
LFQKVHVVKLCDVLQVGIVGLCIIAVISIVLLGKPVIDSTISAFPLAVDTSVDSGPVVPLLDDEFAL